MSTSIGSVPAIMAAMDEPDEKAPKAPSRPWRTELLPPLVNVKGAATILNIHEATLLNWIKSGRMIPAAHTDKGDGKFDSWRVWVAEDVERFAAMQPRERAPKGQAVWEERRRSRRRSPDEIRAQVSKLEAELRAIEAKGDKKQVAATVREQAEALGTQLAAAEARDAGASPAEARMERLRQAQLDIERAKARRKKP